MVCKKCGHNGCDFCWDSMEQELVIPKEGGAVEYMLSFVLQFR
jgi:hypothetical protein